jgi:hypothetical protein
MGSMASAAWFLAVTAYGQQRPPPPWLAATNAYDYRTKECWKRYDGERLKTFGEVVSCADKDVVASLEAAHYPPMDVVRWMVLEHKAIAERVDNRKITPAEGRAQWSALDVRISTELRQRAKAQAAPAPGSAPAPMVERPPSDPQQRFWWERNRCKALAEANRITSVTGYVRCDDTAMRNYLEAIRFPFMDLELANEADHQAHAAELDAGRITLEQELALDDASDQRMITEMNLRVERVVDAVQREALIGALEAFRSALSPPSGIPWPVTTDCRDVLPGQWQCLSH